MRCESEAWQTGQVREQERIIDRRLRKLLLSIEESVLVVLLAHHAGQLVLQRLELHQVPRVAIQTCQEFGLKRVRETRKGLGIEAVPAVMLIIVVG